MEAIINPGEKVTCIKEMVCIPEDPESHVFEQGKVYICDRANSLLVDNDIRYDFYPNPESFGVYFRKIGVANTPSYYNNENGSLYKVATQRGWNPYLFDVVKRLERGGKKDPLKQEIEKSIVVLQLWLNEMANENQ